MAAHPPPALDELAEIDRELNELGDLFTSYEISWAEYHAATVNLRERKALLEDARGAYLEDAEPDQG